ncbi:hypothetical protein [Streptomyces sp. V1I1]|uniref:hypothetical protein n=1 Tax=Streptomyces sp. V1I1 TaxID=3042272 RepID=UPI0027861F90|nr:hypothetical protein [Streptomyces sp. V1I1]MDQ0940370.1 2-oxo-4-hydroxy-4-carboxy--5-ureidoimidazoline (OHCU) decarboxylase [Streptomyces sp. V1I1]
MGRTGTTRRRALMVTGAAAAVVLTGCSTEEPERRRTSGSTADPARAEAALRRRLAATSGALRDQYDAVIAQHPALTGKLAALRAAVAEHVTALAGPAVTALPAVAPPEVPADAAAALKALATAERRISDAHSASLVVAEPELARLLASVAAAGAAHAYLLTKKGS